MLSGGPFRDIVFFYTDYTDLKDYTDSVEPL